MSKGPSPSQRVLEAKCSQCGSQLNLRLPKDLSEGDFTVRCYQCSTRLDVSVHPEGRSRKVTVKDRQKKSFTQEAGEPGPELVGPPKIDLDRSRLPYKKRLRVALVLLIIVGLLGVMSSLLTLSVSFRIKDLEEQSPNDTADLNLWVLDETTGRGILEAVVTISSSSYNQTGYSDQEGLAVMRDVKIGQMELTIEKEGYRTVSGRIEVKKGTPNVLDIPMHRGAPSEIQPLPTQQFKNKTYNPLFTDMAAILMMLSAIMAFVSAFFVHIRDFFFLALFGAFLSIFSLGFFIGSVLALFGLILIILSYEGFEHSHYLTMYLKTYDKGLRNAAGIRTKNKDGSSRRPYR